jgi:hypothetical protein
VPDAKGNIRGIVVPELPWLKEKPELSMLNCDTNERGELVKKDPNLKVWEEAQKAAARHWAGTD